MLRDVFGVREKLNPKMQDMTRPQIESFNFAMQDGLQLAVQDLLKEEFQVAKGGPAVKLWYEDFQIAKPSRDNLDEKLYPNEVRQSRFFNLRIFISPDFRLRTEPCKHVACLSCSSCTGCILFIGFIDCMQLCR